MLINKEYDDVSIRAEPSVSLGCCRVGVGDIDPYLLRNVFHFECVHRRGSFEMAQRQEGLDGGRILFLITDD
jgi:hypothetical protein